MMVQSSSSSSSSSTITAVSKGAGTGASSSSSLSPVKSMICERDHGRVSRHAVHRELNTLLTLLELA